MKKLLAGCFLFFSLSGFAVDPVPYPGRVLVLAPFAESGWYLAPDAAGFGMFAGGGLQFSTLHFPLGAALYGEYGFSPGDDPEILPALGISANYLLCWRFFSLGPALSFELLFPDFAVSPVPAGKALVDLLVHLDGGHLAGLTAGLRYSPGLSYPAMAFFGLRYTMESALMLPARHPRLSLSIDPEARFSPDGDGNNDELRIEFRARPASSVRSARLVVYDRFGRPFRSWDPLPAGEGVIVWGGYSDIRNGRTELVSSAFDYRLVFEVEDIFGNLSSVSQDFLVDVLVMKEGNNYKIRIPGFHFPPDSADPSLLTDEQQIESNRAVIERLLEIFNSFPEYRVLVSGHANSLQFADATAFEREQQQLLVPLSLSRAQAVKDLLVAGGMDPHRIQVTGMGASEPLVGFDNVQERWKNRRVEFLLVQ